MMEQIRINENINLYYLPMGKLKTTTIGIYVHRPLCKSEVSKNALLPFVMKRGCRLCSDSEAVAKYLENLYGASFGASVMKIGDDNIIYLGFETISDRYAPEGERLTEDMARLAMSILFEPSAFDDEVVGQEKKNAVQRILSEINDKRVYAQKRCVEEMFEGKSFAISPMGIKEDIEALDAKTLKAHYSDIITASPIDIYVCGDADINAVAEEIKRFTADRTFTGAKMPQQEMYEKTAPVKRITDKMEVTQGKLCLGFKTGISPSDENYSALSVMCSVFGGGAHSKLFNNVREKLSLCYYASSSLVTNKGVMFVNAGIEFENFEKAYDEILVQLDKVKSGDISELEYTSSINALTNQLESYKDDERIMQIFCLGQKISGTNMDIDTLKEKIRKVGIEDIKRAAAGVELCAVYFLAGKGE